MAKEEWGTKRICPETGKRFYDLNNSPVISPYTGKELILDKSSSEKTKVTRKSEENINDAKFEESEELLTIEDDLILDEGEDSSELDDELLEFHWKRSPMLRLQTAKKINFKLTVLVLNFDKNKPGP